MNGPMAAAPCDHHFEYRILGGQPISVGICTLCRDPNWADLYERAVEVYRWGWQEGRDGKPARETLSAYDKPRACTHPDGYDGECPCPPGCVCCQAAAAAAEAAQVARIFAGLHESAEQDIARVTDLYERWVKAGPPPLGTPMARWWDRRLVELHEAIRPTRHDDGPTVREAAADDRYWDTERAGE